jgi:hypothetical protein
VVGLFKTDVYELAMSPQSRHVQFDAHAGKLYAYSGSEEAIANYYNPTEVKGLLKYKNNFVEIAEGFRPKANDGFFVNMLGKTRFMASIYDGNTVTVGKKEIVVPKVDDLYGFGVNIHLRKDDNHTQNSALSVDVGGSYYSYRANIFADDVQAYTLSLFHMYRINWNTEKQYQPYVGMSIAGGYDSFEAPVPLLKEQNLLLRNMFFEFGPVVGVAYFLNRSIGVSAELGYNVRFNWQLKLSGLPVDDFNLPAKGGLCFAIGILMGGV